MSPRALVLGAKSAIARAIARRLADSGWDLILAAREPSVLKPFARDIELRYRQQVDLFVFDALEVELHATLAARIVQQCGDFQLTVLAFGYLGEQSRAETDGGEMAKILHSNFTGAVICLSHLANYLADQNSPSGIIAIASVAGDRGRASNYFYGAAKGGLALFLQGLRNRLARSAVHVLTVKPGFVDTPMTENIDGMFLAAPPERVATTILDAYKKGRNVIYTPWFWRGIMCVIRIIPERIFKKLHL